MECLKNCSCTAYANSNFNGSCLMRLGDLIDNRELTSEKSGYSVAWLLGVCRSHILGALLIFLCGSIFIC